MNGSKILCCYCFPTCGFWRRDRNRDKTRARRDPRGRALKSSETPGWRRRCGTSPRNQYYRGWHVRDDVVSAARIIYLRQVYTAWNRAGEQQQNPRLVRWRHFEPRHGETHLSHGRSKKKKTIIPARRCVRPWSLCERRAATRGRNALRTRSQWKETREEKIWKHHLVSSRLGYR